MEREQIGTNSYHALKADIRDALLAHLERGEASNRNIGDLHAESIAAIGAALGAVLHLYGEDQRRAVLTGLVEDVLESCQEAAGSLGKFAIRDMERGER